jgi:YaiO family outer membrane protein
MINILTSLFLCASSIGLAQDPQASEKPRDLQNRAQMAVTEKRFSDALLLYRTLLAASPASIDCMLWVARLSAWTGDQTNAVSFYDKALRLEQKNVDAILGKANVLLWNHRYDEAFILLTAASELEPSNPGVALEWSRYYHWQGNEEEAKLYLEKSLASDAKNPEALALKESLVPDHSIELRIAFEVDTLPGTSPGAMEEIGATYFNRKGDVGLDLFRLNRFGQAGNRGGLHFDRKLGGLTSVRAAALFGQGGDIVARQDISAGMSLKLKHGMVVGGDYRHIAFRFLKVDAAIANLDYYFEKPIWILTNFAANRVEGATTPSLLVRFNFRVRKDLTINVGYGHGTEIFQLALPTDFAAFHRDSYIAGITSTLTRKTRVEVTYRLARRSTGTLENMFLLALVHTL